MRSLSQVVVILMLAVYAAVPSAAADKPLAPYTAVFIGPFTVDTDLLKRTDFPGGYEDVLQKEIFVRLLSDRVFPQVVDTSGGNTAGSILGNILVLRGEVTDFNKGNRAARIGIGYGAGSAKLKLVLTFREMDTNREVLRLEQTGRYAGFGNLTGGSAAKARSESARKVVDGLVKQIKAARY